MAFHPAQTWLEIDLGAIEHNARAILDAVKVPGLAVVKDNGYGHGAVEVARTFLKAGGTWLAVVRPHEGVALRQAGITAPIMVFGGAVPEELDLCFEHRLTLPLYSVDQIEWLSSHARKFGREIEVHLKLDTGMGRFGMFAEQASMLARAALQAGGIHIDGIYSHLPVAEKGDSLTPLQLERFKSAVASVEEAGIPLRWKHISNSSAILNWPQSYFNLARIGGILYGIYSRDPQAPLSMKMKTAMSWKARLMSCKQFPSGWGIGYGQTYHTRAGEWIGVVPVGHGDSYHRDPGTRVLIDGQSMPVVGVICMDQMMISMPQHYPMGTEVTIIGRSGGEEITHQELKKIWRSAASNVCLVHPRVPRYYINGEPSEPIIRTEGAEMSDQHPDETNTRKTAEAWDEVGKQFQALGDSLSAAVRAAWNDENSRVQINKVQTRLQDMANDLGDYIKEQTDTPRTQKFSDEVKNVADSVIEKGEKVVEDVRPHLADALRDVTASIQKVINQIDSKIAEKAEPPVKEQPMPDSTISQPEPGQPKDIHD